MPYLSSIHEKANCIAIFWTGRTHSLGSCHFRGVWATCLSHKGGDVPLSALSKDTTSELAGLFSTTFLNTGHQAGKLWIRFLKIFWYDSTRGLNASSTNCESRRSNHHAIASVKSAVASEILGLTFRKQSYA